MKHSDHIIKARSAQVSAAIELEIDRLIGKALWQLHFNQIHDAIQDALQTRHPDSDQPLPVSNPKQG